MNRSLFAIAIVLMSALSAFAAAPRMPAPSFAEFAQRAAAAFDEGVRLREQDPEGSARALETAVDSYESMVRAGASNGPIFYNLGNAHALLNEIGPAMLAYRRAQLFMPNDPNLAANIESLQSIITGPTATRAAVEPPARLRSLLRRTPEFPVVIVTIVAWTCVWLLLGARQFTRRSLRAPMLTACLLAIAGAALAAGSSWARQTDQRAVVVAPETVGRKGPDAVAYAPSFSDALPGGLDVRIVSERPEWIFVRLSDGRETWVPASDIARIQPIASASGGQS